MSNLEILNYLIANNLSFYTQKVFNTLEPTVSYSHNWHIDAISDYLTACMNGDIKFLIINMPPRAMKSISVSIAFSTFLLGHRPSEQVVCASYGSQLSESLSVKSRTIMESPWFEKAFPSCRLQRGQNKKMWFNTTEGGHRFATSVGASVTGFGGNFLILDDPLKPDEAMSETSRRKTNEWLTGTFLSRANNPKDFCFILVMQRLHEDDPSGLLLAKQDILGRCEHLVLPAEFERKTQIITPSRTYIMNGGDYLHEARLGKKELDEKKSLMGSYAYAGQYQQKPAPVGGGIIKTRWFKLFEKRPLKFNKIIHSWDTAIKDNAGADYSVCTVWGVTDDGFYLVDLWRSKVEYPDLKKQAIVMANRDDPDYILIEDKATGQALIQDLKANTKLNIQAIQPRIDKITRASNVTATIECGNVLLDQNGHWLEGFLDECQLFPNAKHDDMVDSMSQFLNWARDNKKKLQNSNKVTYDDINLSSIGQWAV